MKNINIILFLCNWNPHAAYQTLQDIKAEIPMSIRMVRIPCTGIISKALLIKAFEMGADGVALAGCKSGSCRYGSGTFTASENTEDIRNILEILGLGKKRMRLETFYPDDSEDLLDFLKEFYMEIESLGPTPVIYKKQKIAPSIDHKALSDIASYHDVFACQDCGKCTSSCPLALSGKPFSPREVVGSILKGEVDSKALVSDIWSCLTCGLCYDRCPAAVNFPEFIRDVRSFFKINELDVREAHGGFFQSVMRTMTCKELSGDHWDWLDDKISTDKKSKILFFGGCAPYFDIFFRKFLGTNSCNILSDSLRILNFFDIQPQILKDERCCGHDLLWSGDRENFIKLANLNAESMNSLDIEEVITACPECYRTLSHDYKEFGIDLNFKVTHIYEFIDREINKGAVSFKKLNKKITYQDSCRLSRFEGKADLPRKLISYLNTNGFCETADSGNAAICCGNSAWTGCDSYSKALQMKRLKQINETGSDLLVTSCPKCQIHLTCAMENSFFDNNSGIKMSDLTSIIAKTIYWK